MRSVDSNRSPSNRSHDNDHNNNYTVDNSNNNNTIDNSNNNNTIDNSNNNNTIDGSNNNHTVDDFNSIDEIKSLYKIFSKNLIQSKETSFQKPTTITLYETNAREPYSINITNVPANHILLKMDDTKVQDMVFECKKEMCKCADYCLVASLDGVGNWIVYIELKRGLPDSKVALQLNGAKCLFDYGRSIARSYLHNNSFLDGYKERYVCIRGIGKPLSKSPSVLQRVENTTPENFLSLDGMDSVHFMRCVQESQKF